MVESVDFKYPSWNGDWLTFSDYALRVELKAGGTKQDENSDKNNNHNDVPGVHGVLEVPGIPQITGFLFFFLFSFPFGLAFPSPFHCHFFSWLFGLWAFPLFLLPFLFFSFAFCSASFCFFASFVAFTTLQLSSCLALLLCFLVLFFFLH